MNGTVMTAGQLLWEGAEDGTVYDKGWTDDINSETEDGIYCVRTYVDAVESGKTEVIDIWFVDDGIAINYTSLFREQGFSINLHLVNALPETLIPVDYEFFTADVYIVENAGIGYVNMSGTVLTLGQFMFEQGMLGQDNLDRGWSEDIYSETEDGLYCVRVAVDMVETAQIWLVLSTQDPQNFGNIILEDGGVLNVYLVDELPEILLSSNTTTPIINAYVIKDTGISYVSVDDGIMTFGEFLLGEGANYDRGWTQNIYAETEDGFYCVPASKKPDVATNGGFYDAQGNLLASWDTLVNDYGMNIARSYWDYSDQTAAPYNILANHFPTTTKVVISDTVTKIGDGAFEGCTTLRNIKIGSGVTRIGSGAFMGCTNLTSIKFNSNLTVICPYAFEGCNLTGELVIPDSVTDIWHDVFGRDYGDCSGLTSIILGSGIKNMGSEYGPAINAPNVTSITVKAAIPPILVDRQIGLGRVPNLTVIYVPAESVEAYKAAAGWSEYADMIQAIPTT